MTVEYRREGDRLEAFLTGSFDSTSAPAFEKEICGKLDAVRDLRIGLGGVDYISSAGLRTLVYLRQIMAEKGNFALCDPSPATADILEITGISEVINVIKEGK